MKNPEILEQEQAEMLERNTSVECRPLPWIEKRMEAFKFWKECGGPKEMDWTK